METTFNHSISANYAVAETKTSFLLRFYDWCKGQQDNRLGWLAAVLSIHGCALTPITLFAVILAGTNIFFFVLVLIAMGMALVTNLAALPTKITIPVFLLSIIIDVAIIILCAANGFDITSTYI